MTPSSSSDGAIRCTCRALEDDGRMMIQCEKCNTWQHTECLGLSELRIPERYSCPFCLGLDTADARLIMRFYASPRGDARGPRSRRPSKASADVSGRVGPHEEKPGAVPGTTVGASTGASAPGASRKKKHSSSVTSPGASASMPGTSQAQSEGAAAAALGREERKIAHAIQRIDQAAAALEAAAAAASTVTSPVSTRPPFGLGSPRSRASDGPLAINRFPDPAEDSIIDQPTPSEVHLLLSERRGLARSRISLTGSGATAPVDDSPSPSPRGAATPAGGDARRGSLDLPDERRPGLKPEAGFDGSSPSRPSPRPKPGRPAARRDSIPPSPLRQPRRPSHGEPATPRHGKPLPGSAMRRPSLSAGSRSPAGSRIRRMSTDERHPGDRSPAGRRPGPSGPMSDDDLTCESDLEHNAFELLYDTNLSSSPGSLSVVGSSPTPGPNLSGLPSLAAVFFDSDDAFEAQASLAQSLYEEAATTGTGDEGAFSRHWQDFFGANVPELVSALDPGEAPDDGAAGMPGSISSEPEDSDLGPAGLAGASEEDRASLLLSPGRRPGRLHRVQQAGRGRHRSASGIGAGGASPAESARATGSDGLATTPRAPGVLTSLAGGRAPTAEDGNLNIIGLGRARPVADMEADGESADESGNDATDDDGDDDGDGDGDCAACGLAHLSSAMDLPEPLGHPWQVTDALETLCQLELTGICPSTVGSLGATGRPILSQVFDSPSAKRPRYDGSVDCPLDGFLDMLPQPRRSLVLVAGSGPGAQRMVLPSSEVLGHLVCAWRGPIGHCRDTLQFEDLLRLAVRLLTGAFAWAAEVGVPWNWGRCPGCQTPGILQLAGGMAALSVVVFPDSGDRDPGPSCSLLGGCAAVTARLLLVRAFVQSDAGVDPGPDVAAGVGRMPGRFGRKALLDRLSGDGMSPVKAGRSLAPVALADMRPEGRLLSGGDHLVDRLCSVIRAGSALSRVPSAVAAAAASEGEGSWRASSAATSSAGTIHEEPSTRKRQVTTLSLREYMRKRKA